MLEKKVKENFLEPDPQTGSLMVVQQPSIPPSLIVRRREFKFHFLGSFHHLFQFIRFHFH